MHSGVHWHRDHALLQKHAYCGLDSSFMHIVYRCGCAVSLQLLSNGAQSLNQKTSIPKLERSRLPLLKLSLELLAEYRDLSAFGFDERHSVRLLSALGRVN